jgi:hypothetical protein
MLKEVSVGDRRGAQNVCVALDSGPQRELLTLRRLGFAKQIIRRTAWEDTMTDANDYGLERRTFLKRMATVAGTVPLDDEGIVE